MAASEGLYFHEVRPQAPAILIWLFWQKKDTLELIDTLHGVIMTPTSPLPSISSAPASATSSWSPPLPRGLPLGWSRYGALSRLALRCFTLGAFKSSERREKALSRVLEVIGVLKGPLLKVAQLSCTIPHWLSPGERALVEKACALGSPMPWISIENALAHSMGPDWAKSFEVFERAPRYCASLGQVHYGYVAHHGPHDDVKGQGGFSVNGLSGSAHPLVKTHIEIADPASGQSRGYPSIQESLSSGGAQDGLMCNLARSAPGSLALAPQKLSEGDLGCSDRASLLEPPDSSRLHRGISGHSIMVPESYERAPESPLNSSLSLLSKGVSTQAPELLLTESDRGPLSDTCPDSQVKNTSTQRPRNPLPSGALACKILYPDIKHALSSDMGCMGIAMSAYHFFDGKLDLRPFMGEMEARFSEETDYLREAQHMTWFHHLFSQDQAKASLPCPVRIPAVYRDVSTSTCLLMQWQEATPWSHMQQAPQDQRNFFGKCLLWAWFYPFFLAGLIHGDPHTGNIGWHQGALCLFDFGCVRRFSWRFVQGIVQLVQGFSEEEEGGDLVDRGLENVGLKMSCRHTRHCITTWMRFLLAPFLPKNHDDRGGAPYGQEAYGVEEISHSAQGQALALDLYKALRGAQKLYIPQELWIFHRVSVVLGAHLTHLRAKNIWWQEWSQLMALFSADQCVVQQKILQRL